MNKKQIYMVSLCYFTEENIPEHGETIFIRSEQDISKLPAHVLKENIDVEEAMERSDCEGIGNIFAISEEEFFEDYSQHYDLIEI